MKFLLAFLLAFPVWAHGDAAWIDAGGYVNANGMKCCGLNDCAIIPEDVASVSRIGSEVVIPLRRGLTKTIINRIYETGDGHGHPWACTPGCLFRAPGF